MEISDNISINQDGGEWLLDPHNIMIGSNNNRPWFGTPHVDPNEDNMTTFNTAKYPQAYVRVSESNFKLALSKGNVTVRTDGGHIIIAQGLKLSYTYNGTTRRSLTLETNGGDVGIT